MTSSRFTATPSLGTVMRRIVEVPTAVARYERVVEEAGALKHVRDDFEHELVVESGVAIADDRAHLTASETVSSR